MQGYVTLQQSETWLDEYMQKLLEDKAEGIKQGAPLGAECILAMHAVTSMRKASGQKEAAVYLHGRGSSKESAPMSAMDNLDQQYGTTNAKRTKDLLNQAIEQSEAEQVSVKAVAEAANGVERKLTALSLTRVVNATSDANWAAARASWQCLSGKAYQADPSIAHSVQAELARDEPRQCPLVQSLATLANRHLYLSMACPGAGCEVAPSLIRQGAQDCPV